MENFVEAMLRRSSRISRTIVSYLETVRVSLVATLYQ